MSTQAQSKVAITVTGEREFTTERVFEAPRQRVWKLNAPEDLPVMSRLIFQEIVYCLLKSEQGGRLWQLS